LEQPKIEEMACRRILFLRKLMLQDSMSKTGWRPILDQIGPKLREKHPNRTGFFTELFQKLEDRLESRHHLQLATYYRRYSLNTSMHWALCGLMILVGFGSNYLGPSKVVNLWLNPFMAFLAWNFLIFLLYFLKVAVNRGKTSLNGPLLTTVNRFVRWGQSYWRRHMPSFHEDGKFRALLNQTQMVFRREWFRHFPNLVLARTARQLHILAIFLTIGVIGGLYLRGFAEAYQFTWDSTLVAPESRAFWLNFLFGPILWLAQPVFPQGLPAFQPENGAAWIHLFAMAALVYIVFPRAALSIWAHRKVIREKRNLRLPFETAPWQKVYGEFDPHPLSLHFLFYSYQLGDSQWDLLRSHIKDQLPGRFRQGIKENLSWGDSFDASVMEDHEQGLWVLVFNGAQTPESEIHGEFLNQFRQVIQSSHQRRGMLVIVDTQSLTGERLADRVAAWQKVFNAHDLDRWTKISLTDSDPIQPDNDLQNALIWFNS